MVWAVQAESPAPVLVSALETSSSGGGGGGCGGSWAERFPGKAVFPPVSQGQRDRVALMFLLCCACPLHVEGGKV